MIHSIAVLELTQPIGSFYLGKIDSAILIRITKTVRRNANDGIQRELSGKRAKEISKYCEDPDAAFPTPIILAVTEADIKSISQIDRLKDIYTITFDDNYAFAEILDGQHRVEGIKLAKAFQTDLPVVLMFDLTEEEKAYIFSTINSTQTKVDKWLIYDLFDLNQGRSPYKTCHEIARIMNSDSTSPFFGRLKMLGKKSTPDAILSQGTFVNYLCKLMSVCRFFLLLERRQFIVYNWISFQFTGGEHEKYTDYPGWRTPQGKYGAVGRQFRARCGGRRTSDRGGVASET